MKHDEWWKKRVRLLEQIAEPVTGIHPDVLYDKAGFWPLIKLVVMEYLLGPYLDILKPRRARGQWDALHFVDLCSGSGLTRVTPKEKTPTARPLTVAGSALIGAANPGFDHYHFVEPDARSASALEARLDAVLGPGRFTVHPLKAEEAIPRIVEAMQTGSTNPHSLSFVDPEGLTEVTLADMSPLLSMGRGDVLFNFQYTTVKRAVDAADRFFGTPDWPKEGTDEAICDFFHGRLAALGRPECAPVQVVAGKGRYAYEVVYCAARTRSGNRWLRNLEKEIHRRVDGMHGRSLEAILFGQQTLF